MGKRVEMKGHELQALGGTEAEDIAASSLWGACKGGGAGGRGGGSSGEITRAAW